ncbi:MAG: hypothetical protein AAF687_03410 [Pseudomonadota bacterium]
MMVTGSRMRQIGWIASLGLCLGIFIILSFNVHAVKSEVLLAERKIVQLKRETLLLETEFQTRASQRQLANWNSLEFGFEAPRADQYVDGERQLAKLGQPLSPDAPAPIRVARVDLADASGSSQSAGQRKDMVSPLTGEPITLASVDAEADAGATFTEAFGEMLLEASPIATAQATEVNE